MHKPSNLCHPFFFLCIDNIASSFFYNTKSLNEHILVAFSALINQSQIFLKKSLLKKDVFLTFAALYSRNSLKKHH